jgi:hypothetical protein
VTGRLFIAMAGRLVAEVGWQRCCLKDCWGWCSSLGLARWGVLFSEARWSQRVNLAVSHLSLRRPALVASYTATYRTCRVDTRTALLELNVLTGPSHLADWLRVRVTLRLTVSQSVCLWLSPLCGRLTRYCFLFKC